MKPVTAVALIALLAAGCSNQQSPDPGASQEAKPAAPTATRESASDGKLAGPLPEGVELGFRHYVRSDHVVERGDKPDRRAIELEYLEGDNESTLSSIDRSLRAAGFRQRSRKRQPNGNIRAKFDKAGFGTVIVTITPTMDRKARAAEAIGRIVLDWPVR